MTRLIRGGSLHLRRMNAQAATHAKFAARTYPRPERATATCAARSTADASQSKVGVERIAAAGRTRWFAAPPESCMHAAAHTLEPSGAGRPLPALHTEDPLPAALGRCTLIHGFLDAEECAAQIESAQARGFVDAGSDYPPSYRNNDRQVLDDAALAQHLFERLRAYAPPLLVDADGARWRLHSLNERLRLCRYLPGQRFNIHQDGVHHRGPDLRTRLTFMIYLTDGAAFEGGDTLFYAQGPRSDGDAHGAPPVIARVRPRAGTLIVFDHALWHAGEAVSRGVKHILRSDLLYARETPAIARAPATAATTATAFAPGHDGYVWSLSRLSDGRVVSSGRDAAIRLWSRDGLAQTQLRGHRQSVLGVCEAGRDRLLSVSRDRCLRMWDLGRGECLGEVAAHDAAALCLLALDAQRFASGGADARIALWSAHGQALGSLRGHTGWVWGLCRAGVDRLLSASEDGELRLWDSRALGCVEVWRGATPLRSVDARALGHGHGSHVGSQVDSLVGSSAVSRAGFCVASGDIAGRIRLFELQGERLRLVREWSAHDAAVRRVRWLADGRLLSCGEDGRVRVWSVDRGRSDPQTADAKVPVYERQHANFATDAIELDDGRLLSCGYDGELRCARMD